MICNNNMPDQVLQILPRQHSMLSFRLGMWLALQLPRAVHAGRETMVAGYQLSSSQSMTGSIMQSAGGEEGGAGAAAGGAPLSEGGDWALEGPTAGRCAAGVPSLSV